MISPSLKSKVQKNIFHKILFKNALFADPKNQKHVPYVLDHLSTSIAITDQTIFNQNDIPNGIYFLSSGILELIIQDWDGKPFWEKEMEVGTHFGELSILRGGPRTGTVRAVTHATVARMNLHHVRTMF